MRNGLRCLPGIDRPAGKVIRRYERAEPGDLIRIGHQKSRQNLSPNPTNPKPTPKAERFNRTLTKEFL